MDRLQIKGNWNIIKGKLKQQYADLTDDEWKYVEGKENEFLGKLLIKIGESKEEMRESIKRYSSAGMDNAENEL
ncbi:MAG TPA: general stress protein CsbD [Ignavibacteriales bacterium]|nr:general stress protein CsbD [Ignavibacteriales bacterium]